MKAAERAREACTSKQRKGLELGALVPSASAADKSKLPLKLPVRLPRKTLTAVGAVHLLYNRPLSA